MALDPSLELNHGMPDLIYSITQVTANGNQTPKVNSAAMLYAAKRNDYERVKILYR